MSRSVVTAADARALVPAFGLTPTQVEPLGRGLINDTFAVTDDGGRAYVLQRVHPVFDPRIHHNIEAVTEHLANRGLCTPRLVRSADGGLWVERDGAPWRMMIRMSGVSLDVVEQPAQARAAARLLGRFHSALDDLPHRFEGLRVGVHDTPAHLRRLERAVSEHREHRLWSEVAPLAEQLLCGAEQLPSLQELRPRVVHGDPKLNNVLFEAAEGEGALRAQCWIDLDTVAPMPLAVELGDAWRSWCNPRGEDESGARFDLEIYRASLTGYREGCSMALGAEEREALLYGVEWITLELAARFAADALAEAYFGWDASRFATRGEHNLVRAAGQWSLHQAVLATRTEREAALRQAW